MGNEIDFTRKTASPARRPATKVSFSRRWGLRMLSATLLAGAIGVAGYRQYPNIVDLCDDILAPDDSPEQRPAAIMFVLDGQRGLSKPQGQAAASMLVREWCDGNDVEYRRYQHNADLFQESTWVREMQSFGREFGVPCLVLVDRDGRGKVEPIPPGVEQTIRLLELVFNVSK